MIGRRQFLTSIGALGMGLMFQGKASASQQDRQETRINYLPSLITVLEELNSYDWGCPNGNTEWKEKLVYAYNEIEPSNQHELAVTVAVISTSYDDVHIVDEYARRCKGLSPVLYDHPILELSTKYAVPSTYRVYVFREQIVDFIYELMVDDEGYVRKMDPLEWYKRTARNIEKPIPLRDIASPRYLELLSAEEFRLLDQVMEKYVRHCIRYTYCSTVAQRAMALARV